MHDLSVRGAKLRPMPDTIRVFAVIDALVAALRTAAEPGGPLAGVAIEDAWPGGRINSKDTVIVADATGNVTGATMRAGGGTRDDEFTIDVAVAAVRKRTDDAKVARDRAAELAVIVDRVVRDELPAALAPHKVRALRLNEYDVRQFVHDKGRECDLHLRVSGTARLLPTGAA